jgi:DNA-directed RNA polymerase alpha subunit
MTSFEIERDHLIIDKVRELQDLLEKWAENSQILKPGERIVFSLRIEGVPTVVHADAENLWEMPTREFFSAKRLQNLGVKRIIAVRISNCMLNECGSEMSMRKFLMEKDKRELLRIPNFGSKSVVAMIRVLAEAGMTLKERP